MKKLFVILGMLVLSSAAVAVAMSEGKQDKTYSWRYKMTVEVETPEGIVVGSAVREVTVVFEPNSAEKSGYYPRKTMKGEAVVVDLGERGKVFALLKGPLRGVDYGSTIPFSVFEEGPPGMTIEGAEFYSQLKAKKTVEPTYYPTFVTFTNMNDPKTIVPLLEMESNKGYPKVFTVKKSYFEKYFGKGVSLKSVTIEMSDEGVTWGIEKYIRWLPERKHVRGYLGGQSEPPYNDPSKTYLNGVEFSKGKFW